MADLIDRINQEVKKAIEGELRMYPGSSFYFYRNSTVRQVGGYPWITCYIHISGVKRNSRIYLEEGIRAMVNDALYYIQDGLYVEKFNFQYD